MKYLLAPLFCFFSIQIVAQQNHFIYIQSDNQQAFYVKIDKKIMSSSASGYLIIPKLVEGSYDLSIGFPKSEWPEQYINCNVKQADAGYLLKNFGDKGWGLFNFQTMDLVMAGEKKRSDSTVIKQKNEDAFANILANVVNDPGIKIIEEVKDDIKPEILPVKTNALQKETAKKNSGHKKIKSKPGVAGTKNRIKKLGNNKTTDSGNVVYVDLVKGKGDTINVVIPSDNPVTIFPVEMNAGDSIKTGMIKDAPIADSNSVTAVKVLPKTKTEEIIDLPVKPVVGNKKIKKKTTPPKAENKNVATGMDSTVVIIPENKALAVIVAPVKPLAANKKIIKKTSKPKVETTKTDIKEAMVTADTIKLQPENKTMITAVDTLAKADIQITLPVKDTVEVTTVLTKELPKSDETKAEDKVKQKIAETTIKILDVPVRIEKVTEKIIIPEKPKEVVVTNGNPYFPIMNIACKNFVEDDEYLSLRKKMDKSKKENEMLYMVHKVFEKKCFSTRQVQRLSLLFITDEGKYKFFDDAYHFTADLENFASLESELRDEYFVKRFRAMIR